jgi:hypothetical protein
MLRPEALVRTDVSEDHIAYIFRATRTGELGTLAVTTIYCSILWLLVTADVPSSPILLTLMMEVIRSSKMSVLSRATWHNILEDSNLQVTLI